MADALTTITKLINSPPGQLAAGGVLAGIVWKFFKNVGDVLNEKATKEIAVWLVGGGTEKVIAKPAGAVLQVTSNMVRFLASPGATGLRTTLIAFFMAVILSLSQGALLDVTAHFADETMPHPITMRILVSLVLWLPILWSLRLWRDGMNRIVDYPGTVQAIIQWLIMSAQGFRPLFLLATISLAIDVTAEVSGIWRIGGYQGEFVFTTALVLGIFWVVGIPALLVLLLVPSYIILLSRRVGVGFQWFTRHFDIEKKPPQSIGLVAGALVAIVYWTAVIVSRVVG